MRINIDLLHEKENDRWYLGFQLDGKYQFRYQIFDKKEIKNEWIKFLTRKTDKFLGIPFSEESLSLISIEQGVICRIPLEILLTPIQEILTIVD